MTKRLIKIIITNIFLLTIFISCKKSWLEDKPNQALLVPATPKDLQAILDGDQFVIDQPNLGELGTNDYYLDNSFFGSQAPVYQNIYKWAAGPDFYAGTSPIDWWKSYTKIFNANTVLENLKKIESIDSSSYASWANVKGSALFYRACMFYNVSQLFSKPYIPVTAGSDLGIVLRLEPDINIPSVRSTVQQTYERILSDLLDAKSLLPKFPLEGYKTRPSRHAAFAMLARVYLSMQDYSNALVYADSSLQVSSTLMSYFQFSTTLNNPFASTPGNNPEIIFFSRLALRNLMPVINYNGYVDSTLFQSYDPNDLRKTLFFKSKTPPSPPRLAFGGSYTGDGSSLFSGLATDEIYLVKAECLARNGNKDSALQVLNALIKTRWKNTVPYPNITASTPDEALTKILAERRKELCFRAIRWTDLRRLNQDSRFAITLSRGVFLGSLTFTLPPNDNRYVYPIPNDEILFSGIPQNPR